jgi:hypothetical protein
MAVARKNRDGRSTQRPARRCRGLKRLGRASDRTGRAGTVCSANPTLPASSLYRPGHGCGPQLRKSVSPCHVMLFHTLP